MSPAVSWNARSSSSNPNAATSSTAIMEHAARPQEPNQSRASSQIAGPLRSRYAYDDGSSSSRNNSLVGTGDLTAGRASAWAGSSEQSKQSQSRYSSSEAHRIDGKASRAETAEKSPSSSTQNRYRRSSARGDVAGGSGYPTSDEAGNGNGALSGKFDTAAEGGAGSALRPGARSNYFFGADYSTLAATAHGERQEMTVARLPRGNVEAKAAAFLGGVTSTTAVRSQAQKRFGAGQREGLVGNGEGSHLTSGAASTSPRKDEPPPSFAPLAADEDDASGSVAGDMDSDTSGRARRSDGGQVAFPSDFDEGRKSGSDSDEGGKPTSSGSLGTKSGSTSLLSMLSGSPRSLGTAHDSAAGSPSPRTSLSDHSSSSEGAATRGQSSTSTGEGVNGGVSGHSDAGSGRPSVAAVVAARNRKTASAAPSPWSHSWADADRLARNGGGSVTSAAAAAAAAVPSVAHRPRTRSAVGGATNKSSGNVARNLPTAVTVPENDDDVPSAHPTPLSTVGGGDADVPSDHPTPLSSFGAGRRNGSGGIKSNRSSSKLSTAGTAAMTDARNPSSSSFMQRLKYWGGGGGGAGSGADVQVSSAKTRHVEPSGCPSTPQSLRASGTSRSVGTTSAPAPANQNRYSHTTVEYSSPESSICIGSDLLSSSGIISPSELHGVKVMPYDSFASDATSTAGSQLWRATAPPLQEEMMGDAAKESKSSFRHRDVNASYGSVEDLAGLSPLASSVSTASKVQRQRQQPREEVREEQQPAQEQQQQEERFDGGVPVLSASNDDGDGYDGATFDTAALGSASGSAAGSAFSGFGAAHRAELAALRRARGTPAPGDAEMEEYEQDNEQEDVVMQVDEEDAREESDMDWEAVSDEEQRGGKTHRKTAKSEYSGASTTGNGLTAEKLANMATPYARGLGAGPMSIHQPMPELQPEHEQELPPPPRYMAIVDAANVSSALDHSSTSEQDTSPSEDDGGMMAEILTDRLLEVCKKMDSAVAPPADELSDGDGAGGKRRAGGRRRQMTGMSSSRTFKDNLGTGSSRRQKSFFSSSGLNDGEDDDEDSDEGTIRDDGVVARKLRRERLRKRSRAQTRRALQSALTVPTDDKGETINVHTAAYNGVVDLLVSYITQGGDLEVRDQFQATALMLCSEQGHTEMVDKLLAAGAETGGVDENGNSALHLACFYGNRDVVEILLSVDVDLTMVDLEGRTPLDLATDSAVRRMVRTEEVVRLSGQNFDLLGAVEVNDTTALAGFITMGREACGFPHKANATSLAARRLRLDRHGRGGMTAVHLAAFHGYADSLRLLLEGGADANSICDDGESPLHTACTGGSTLCATILLEHGANPLATDSNGLVPCEKHIAGGRQEMKRLLETKAFQATPANLLALRAELAEVELQIDAEEDLFVRKGVAIKYLRKALKKKESDTARLRQAVDARDMDIRNLGDRMDSVHSLLVGISVQ